MTEPVRGNIPTRTTQSRVGDLRTDRLRAGDADRDTTSALLSEAVAQGYLTMPEFEQRSSQVLQARTVGELRALEVDLPVDRIDPGRRRTGTVAAKPPSDESRAARTGLYAHVGSYVAGVVVMLAIWLVVGLVADAWYFWPVWPILGWGIGVASHAIPVITGRGGCATRSGCGSRTRALHDAP